MGKVNKQCKWESQSAQRAGHGVTPRDVTLRNAM